MMEYYLTVLIMIIVLLFSLVSVKIVFFGLIGLVLSIAGLYPVATDPTVIMGVGYNITNGSTQIITLTQNIPELRWIIFVVIVINLASVVVGVLNNLNEG